MLPTRLSGRKVCERVKKKGQLFKSAHFSARFFYTDHEADGTPYCRIGLITPTTLSKLSVERNRMRRRVREAFRLTLKSTQCHPRHSYSILLLPRTSSMRVDFSVLLFDMERFVSFLFSL